MMFQARRFLVICGFLVSVLFCHAQETVDIERLDPNMTLTKADSDGIAWLDPRSAPFRLVGFPWIGEDHVYRRLPVEPDWEIRGPVDSLANCTAGGQIHFRSNSQRILLRVRLRQSSGMYHMPATGQSGFDLYLGEPGKQRYFSTSRFDANAGDYEVTLFEGNEALRHFTLNFPLYNGVEAVEIGVVAGASVSSPMPFSAPGKIIVYGTSITQGGCAARPGMAYSNILSRWLNLEFVNLGFSGNGRGELALAKLISQIDNQSLVILDYQANAGETIRDTLEPFIEELRRTRPQIPLLVISKIRYAAEIADEARMKAAVSLAAFQKALVERLRTQGDRYIHFLDGAGLLGESADECTVDGVHPTDLGFMRMAEGIAPAIQRILELSSE